MPTFAQGFQSKSWDVFLMLSFCCGHEKHRSNDSLPGWIHWISSNFRILLFFLRIWNFVQSSFFPKGIIDTRTLFITDMWLCQVLNAVFFQPKGPTTFHVFVNTLSLRVPRVLYDHWNGTRFLFNKDLFPDKLKNFNGLVLRATSFNFPPYTYQARP